MLVWMIVFKRVLIVLSVILIVSLVGACGNSTLAPSVTATITSSPPLFVPSITPSRTPLAIPLPTNTYTASPEPDIAPNCRITNEGGQLYLLSDAEFHDLGTLERELDQALARHYPEWASYTQTVSWSTQPAKLGEIIVAASLDEYSNLQINPAVTLVTLGDSLDWQLPSNTDLYLKSQEISTELNRLSFDWEDPQNESLRSQYPAVANSGTYAFYAYFNHNLDGLQSWCNTYHQLFAAPP
jgi:hypothetical protein